MTPLEKHLREIRATGRPALVLYLTGGFPGPGRVADYVRAAAAGGADVVEVGIPWSDPVIDGPVIQRSTQAALEMGATPVSVLEEAASADVDVPVVALTYTNPVYRMGWARFAGVLADGGLDGAIIPDLPLEESSPWEDAAAAAGIAAVMLAPPNATDERLIEIDRRSSGFVYGTSLLGVTGMRESLSAVAARHGDRLRRLLDQPVMMGIGISTVAQAAEVASHVDGVILGTAVIRRIIDGASPAEIESFARDLRRALDAAVA